MLEPDGPSIAALLIVRYWWGILCAFLALWLWDHPEGLAIVLIGGTAIVVVVATLLVRADLARRQAGAARTRSTDDSFQPRRNLDGPPS